MSVVGDNIKKRREALGFSQVDLADAIGETKQTIWKYESGTVTNIPLPKVEAIAKALSCTPNELTGWEDDLKVLAKETAQHNEVIEAFDSLPPELRANALSLIKDLARLYKSPDDRGGSD